MKLPGIYKLYWDNCDYFYYGQSVNFYDRRKGHLSLLKKGKHENVKLLNIYNKYGIPNIKLLLICGRVDLTFYEQVLLDSAVSNINCCNNNFDASGTTISESTKNKLRLAQLGKIHPVEQNKKHSEYLKGRRVGEKHPMFGKPNPFKGKKHSEKTRKIMSQKSNKFGANNGRARIVLNLETGIFYDCAVRAAIAHNIPESSIYKKLNNHRYNNTSLIFA